MRKVEIEREEAETEVIIRDRHGHRTDEDRTERSRGAELKWILSSCLIRPMSVLYPQQHKFLNKRAFPPFNLSSLSLLE